MNRLSGRRWSIISEPAQNRQNVGIPAKSALGFNRWRLRDEQENNGATSAAGLAIVAVLAVRLFGLEATKDAASSATQAASSAASVAETAANGAAGAASSVAAGTTTLYYPEQQGAMFSIEAPAGWTVGKIDQVGDFGSVESPDGSVLQFRAQKFATDAESKQEIDSIVDSHHGVSQGQLPRGQAGRS